MPPLYLLFLLPPTLLRKSGADFAPPIHQGIILQEIHVKEHPACFRLHSDYIKELSYYKNLQDTAFPEITTTDHNWLLSSQYFTDCTKKIGDALIGDNNLFLDDQESIIG